ncbi:exodeoxyribonuclease V subunit alpha [Marinomonas sp. THO17]|uniref:exodeoxyribonuclease V subunit alpha n=1 Tax=Marinomonas sp. THO17 TaxID=3149048 RepID=UPI00336BDF7B
MDSSKQLDWLQQTQDDRREMASPSLTTSGADILFEWRTRGVLNAVDEQWIRQLAEHAGEQHLAVLMAGAMTSAALGAGHICMDLAAVWQSPEGLRGDELRHHLSDVQVNSVAQWCAVLQNSPLVSGIEPLQAKPLVLVGTRLYFYRYYQYEQTVLAYLQKSLSKPVLSVDQSLIQSLFPQQNDTVDWQKVAVANAASQAFAVISGGPGTGKTTTVTKLLALLVAQAQQQGQSLRIELAAPTGKAAARLTESIANAKASLPLDEQVKQGIPEQASTLHRLLGSEFGRSRFKHHQHNPLHLDVLLVDEVSMVDLPMMAKLIEALPAHARLILLGDKDQLASVEAGSVLGDLSHGIENAYFQPEWAEHLTRSTGEQLQSFANSSAAPISRALTLLRTSYRFSADSGIGHLAKAMNTGQSDAVFHCLQQGYEDLAWHVPKEGQPQADVGQLAKGYEAFWQKVRAGDSVDQVHEAFNTYQILTAVRQGEFGVERINAQLEALFYQRGMIMERHKWYPGKAVMLTRNDATLGLFNGDIGICLADADGRLRVWFMQPNGEYLGLLPSRLNEYELVFAMTVHKSQGSEFDQVALVLPLTPSPVLTKELLYTGITRAKQGFSLWGTQEVIRMATQSRIKRYSGLLDALWSSP